MNFSVYQNRLSKLSARFNLMVALVFGLLLANILLSALAWYTSIHQRVLVTPFEGGTGFTHSESNVDPKYLSMMSENFIYSRLNVTPGTITNSHQRLLTYVDGSRYAPMQAILAQEDAVVQKNKISSDFIITNIQLKPRELKTNITGLLHRAVGGRTLQASKMTYELTYRYRLGRLSILSFTKIKEWEHA
jgi:conjugal transfer pilus assembly protein TraE